MTTNGFLQLATFFLVLLLLTKPLGIYMAKVFSGEKVFLSRLIYPIENLIYRICGINKTEEQPWTTYTLAMLLFNFIGAFLLYFLQRLQSYLPLNPQGFNNVTPDLAFNTAVSFTTNTNWQAYSGESTMSYLTQMLGLAVQNFLSAAVGMAVAIAFIRSIARRESQTIGNFWVDLTRSIIYVLLPLCLIGSLFLVSQGVVQNFNSYSVASRVEPVKLEKVAEDGRKTIETISEQVIAQGPVASQEIIKQIGTNGGGFFNANSAHPFENPSYFSNFTEIVCILLIPFALIITFGFWLKNHKQSTIILAVLIVVLFFEFITVTSNELNGNPKLNNIINESSPNWAGKETRLGIVGSGVFEASISNVSGSANSSLESFHPIAIALSLFNLSNQAIFGVQGFGLVFTINAILYTAFFIGLMLGKTPQVFGKKIEKNEIILSSVLILINPFLVLLGVALTLNTHPIESTNFYDHIHYFTRVFYEFASGAASNGSGLEGLADNTIYWNLSLAIVMFLARYGAMATMIALGASLAKKPIIPETVATFKTDTILFGFIFLFISISATLLIYLPFIILSPISEMLIKS